MSKVLILTAGYGEGHNAAARGLQAAFTALGTEAQIVDLFELTGGAFYQRTRKGYIDLINTAPRVWAAIYRLLDVLPLATLSLPFLGSMTRLLRRMLEEQQPDAVISVYPIYSYVIHYLYPQRRPFAFHTVITDSITINSVWHRAPSDTLIVPNEDSAQVLLDAGLPPKLVHTLGFPVAPRFAHDRPLRPGPETPRILYMINAGRDRAGGIVRRLLAIEPLHLTVTVGRDEALRAELENIAAEMGRPLEIHGWTNQMPELLMTHHLLIGKAGGATVQETIAACTPMLLTQIVPGQEEGNAKLLLQNHCGALCETAGDLGATVERLFARGGARWREWEANITRLSKPDAGAKIARFVLDTPAFMIEAILFDIGNVLLPFDFSRALAKLAAESDVPDPVEVLERIDRIKLEYEDGQIDRAAFLRSVFDLLNYRGTESAFIAAWEDIFDPNEPMFALVEQLHGRYPLYLLSNTSDIHREYFFRHYPIFQRFAGGVYSYEVQLSKPHREIYETTARLLGLNPAATFFIDDLLPNIEGARALGFQAHHYHHHRHEALLADLRSAGVSGQFC